MLKIRGRFNGPTIAVTASIQLALVAIGFALTASAVAQNSDNQLAQITVQAGHQVQKKHVGMSYTGIPIEQVSLSRQVGFRDLDLASPAGKSELDKRIKVVAKEACNQLRTLYPLEQWDTDNRSCVADAVQGAKTQEQTILASSPGR
jgi:UrcA family protein